MKPAELRSSQKRIRTFEGGEDVLPVNLIESVANVCSHEYPGLLVWGCLCAKVRCNTASPIRHHGRELVRASGFSQILPA